MGLALGIFDLPILPGVSLLFTGVCYLLIALSYGPVAGALVAAIASAPTIGLYGDFYTVFVAVLESATIGELTRNKRRSSLAAASLFWLVVGFPVLYGLIFLVPHQPAESGWAIIVKRIVNGFANVAIADFLLLGAPVQRVLGMPPAALRHRSLRQVIAAALLMGAVLPMLFLSIIHGRSFAQHEEREASSQLQEGARIVCKEIDEYVDKHLGAIASIGSAIAAQGRLDRPLLEEQLRRQNSLFPGFLTMLVADRRGEVMATSGGESERRTGGSFVHDRDYFRVPIESGKPYISDVFLGRALGHDPIVAVSAVIPASGGEPLGLIEGSLDLAKFSRFERTDPFLEGADILILDQHNRVIYASQRLHYAALAGVSDDRLRIYRRPASQYFLSAAARGSRGNRPQTLFSYRQSALTGWQTIVAQSTLPIQRSIELYYLRALAWLMVAAAAAFLLSTLVARHITSPLAALLGAFREFDPASGPEAPLVLAPSAPTELAHLQVHFNELSARLGESHAAMAQTLGEKESLNLQLHAVLADLDRKVQERTAELAEARVRAEDASKAKSVFLANMSHEIRTPLNAVLGYSQVMLRDGSLSAESRRYLQIINSSGEHLLALLNDILDMSRIEAGRMKVDPTAFNMARLVYELSDMFRLRASSKGLAFDVVEHAGLCRHVLADQGKIRQVLINLLGNAVKFTARGWVRLDVSTPRREGGQLWLVARVEDSGIGIGEPEMSRLFQPFTQAGGGLHTEGTGLGLVISRQFARLMGGDLTVASHPGEGANFQLEVPVEAVPESETLAGAPRVSFRRLASGDEKRILVVDDDARSREWLGALLGSVGFLTREAADGATAVALAGEWRPDLIFMDMLMPVMDGFAAARAIRARQDGHRPVIISLSASATDEHRLAALAAGVDEFVAKPCRALVLLQTIADRLGVSYEAIEAADASSDRATDLSALSAETVDALHQATLNGEKARIDQIIATLSSDPSVAARLQDLADRYEYDALAELCAASKRRRAEEASAPTPETPATS